MKTTQNGRTSYRLHERQPHQEPVGSEPDYVVWGELPSQLGGHGVKCEITRGPGSGCWGGCVYVEPGHPWYGVEWGDLPDEAHRAVHGGITSSVGGRIGWDASHYRDRRPWRDPSATHHDERGRYVTARQAEYYTRALARLAVAAMYAAAGGAP